MNSSPNPVDRVKKIVNYISNLPEKLDCKIKLSYENNIYINVTLHKNAVLHRLLNYLKAEIDAIVRILDELWRAILEEADEIIKKYIINNPDLMIKEDGLEGNIFYSMKLIKTQFKAETRTLDIYSLRMNKSDILFSWILNMAHDILEILCMESDRLFEEKSMQFEKDIRIYAIKLYGLNNRQIIENAIHQYYNILENLRKRCMRHDKLKPLDELYNLIEEIKEKITNS